MATVEEITDRFRTAVESGPALDKTIKFDLKGEGFICIDGATVTNDDMPADLTFTVAKSDLEDMGAGRLDPMGAVMTGKMKISNMGLAMQLQSKLQGLFSRAR